MLFAFLIACVFSKPEYLDEPQDCYVPDPELSCTEDCINDGGSSPCLNAMGFCLAADEDAIITVNGVIGTTNQQLFVPQETAEISVSVTNLGHDLRYYYAAVSEGVVFTSENSGHRFCEDNLIRTPTEEVVNAQNFTIQVNSLELDSFDFAFVYGSEYGQIYGVKVTVNKQGLVQADYIVVGAGPGGSFAASELAKSNSGSVLLLEWGVDDSHEDWYGRSGGDSMLWSTSGLWSTNQNQAIVGEFPMATIVGGNQMHNGMHYTRIPFADFDRWDVKWTESFWRDTYSILENDATMTWRPADDSLVGFDVDTESDMGLIAGKVSGMRFTATCEFGDCQWGDVWNPSGQQANNASYRIARHTWYNDLISGNDGVQTITFNQATKVESLVIVDGVCTGVKLGNGDIMHAGKGVILSGGVFGTSEILLRSEGLTNEYVGQNLHHHHVIVQEITPSMLAGTFDCSTPAEYQSYMAPSGNGFFRFRKHCTDEIGWMYMPSFTYSTGDVGLDENGNFIVNAPDAVHADDVGLIMADIQEFYSHITDPFDAPTVDPTFSPTYSPTVDPSFSPTYSPTVRPSFSPTYFPTVDPSFSPTYCPTQDPIPDERRRLEDASSTSNTSTGRVYTPSLAIETVEDPDLLRAFVSDSGNWEITWHFGGTCSAGTCTNRRLKVNGLQNVYVGDNSAAATSFNGHGTGMAGFLGIAAARFLLEDQDRGYIFYNLHRTAQDREKVYIASMFDNNVITLPDGSQVLLQTGEVYQYDDTVQGDTLFCKKPCGVNGESLTPNMYYEWIRDVSAGRDFAIYNSRFVPRTIVHALEPAVVTMTVTNGAILSDEVTLQAGETYVLGEMFNSTNQASVVRIQSTGDILAQYYSFKDEDGSSAWSENDIVNLEPMYTEWIGSPSGSAWSANPLGSSLELVCNDGSTTSSSNTQKKWSGTSQWNHPGCIVSGDLPFSTMSVGDGSGTDAVSWVRTDRLGTVGIIVQNSNVLYVVSLHSTTCQVGDQTVSLQGQDGVFHVKLTSGISAGTIIRCDDPVAAFHDPTWSQDEGRVFMFDYEDTHRPTMMPSKAPSTSAPTTPAPSTSPTTSAPTGSPSVSPSKQPTIYVPEIPSYEFINLYPFQNAELFIAAALDDTTITLANGNTIIMNAGEVYKGYTDQFDIISGDRPITISGMVHNNRFEFVQFKNRAREFWLTNFREIPILGIYALEDTQVNLTYHTDHSSKNFLEWTQFDLSAGEYRSEMVNFTEVDLHLRNSLAFHVQSTGDILVAYTGHREENAVDMSDFHIGQPGSTSVLGGISSNAVILNYAEGEYEFECSDGRSLQTKTNKRYQVSGPSDWEGAACRARSTTGTLLWAASNADGGGYDAVSWLSPDNFGKIGVCSTETNTIFFVSEGPAVCTVGAESIQLVSNSTVYKYMLGRVSEGTIISCDIPVGVWVDPRSNEDEGFIPMYNYMDPCDRCHTEKEFDPVCSPTMGGFDNECFALCNKVTDFVHGSCEPTRSPTTSGPTKTPTLYPTTDKPTEMPIPLYTTDERMYILQDLLAQTTRHVMLQQVQQEHDLRSRGSSGMTRIRAYRDGEENYLADGGLVNGAMMTMHNHPDFPRTMGLGEFGAVLNGVRFDTRHNDYKIRKPAADALVNYNSLEEIDYPGVPKSVSDLAGNVTAQIEEMQMYFKAFKEQDTSIREDYKDFFKPVLCYLEGGWVKDEELEDPFASDRHQLDHDSWKGLHEAQVFRANSGKKHRLENTPFLPTKIVDVRLDPLNGLSVPVFANFEYRIACQDFEDDIPTERFYIDGPESALQKNARGGSEIDMESLYYGRAAHFKMNSLMPDEWETNKNKGREQSPRPVTSRTFIDHLMEQIPGKDGPLGDLSDDSFKTPSTPFRDLDNDLNTAFYSRFFSIREPDAMGRQDQMRGYNDGSLWAAMTSHTNVAGNSVCDDGERELRGETECWTQKWTYAVPLEIVYLTPLENWNPCNLEERDNNDQPAGRDGSEENPFLGWSKNMFSKTPYQFFESERGTDLADTGTGHFAEGQNGEVCYVISSGTKIITDNIGQSVGPVRLRYPIFPIHDQSNLAFREASAVKKTLSDEMARENAELRSTINQLQAEFESFKNEIVNLIGTSNDFNQLVNTVGSLTDGEPVETTTTTPEQQVGKWTEQTYPIAKLISGPGFPEAHTHDVYCDWSCFLDLYDGLEAEVTSEDWDGHTHVFRFKFAEGSRVELELTWCDSCNIDTHSAIFLAGENTEVFLPFR